MQRESRFARCPGCGHAAVTHAAMCAFCDTAVEAADPPADLFTAWRCTCAQCLKRPC